MSEPAPISASAAAPPVRADVSAAIARAAQATGADFGYLLAQARLESGFDPEAHAASSSAAGLYQFTRGTWAATLARHGAAHGLGWAGAAVSGLGGAGGKAQAMALRYDPDAAAMMAAELTNDNRATLTTALGRAPAPAELYLAHFLGAGGAVKFLGALSANPDQPAAPLFGAAAGANRAIFYTAGGDARSLGQVMALLSGKVAAAMSGSALPGALPDGFDPADPASMAALLPGGTTLAAATTPQGPLAQEFAATASAAPSAPAASMADTLAATFGLGGQGAAAQVPDHVRAAYGLMQAFGL